VTKGSGGKIFHLWCKHVALTELTIVERQQNQAFAELLCRLRFGPRISWDTAERLGMSAEQYENQQGFTDADVETLNTRIMANLIEAGKLEATDMLEDAVRLFHTNVQVNDYNTKIMKRLLDRGHDSATFVARDCFCDPDTELRLKLKVGEHVPKKPDQTGGLQAVVNVAVTCRVMIRRNIDVADKVVNGSSGTVAGWYKAKLRRNGKPESVSSLFVCLDTVRGKAVGQKCRATWKHKHRGNETLLKALSDCEAAHEHPERLVPIDEVCAQFNSENKQYQMQRVQVPVVVAYSMTIHKCQVSNNVV
jgi:hypothetical protein